MGLGFALDFSKANGTLEDTGYIHSITKPEQNAYLKLMEEFSQAFVDIKNEMTTFQVYGFGARDPDSCFALQGYENDDPNVQSFDDVKELYMEKATELEGSEQFALAPVLRQFAEHMESVKDQQQYRLLLIMIPDTTPANAVTEWDMGHEMESLSEEFISAGRELQ